METAIFDPVKSVAKAKIKSIVTLNIPRFVENSWTIFAIFAVQNAFGLRSKRI